VNRITFVYDIHACLQYVFRTSDGDRTPHRGLGDHRRCFLALMVDAPRFFVNTHQGARRRYFLALMVGAPGSSAPSPLRGAPSTFLALMVATPGSLAPSPPRGAHHRRFLAFMVDALRSSVPVPPKGPPSMFFSVDGGCSRISSSGTFQGGHYQCFLVACCRCSLALKKVRWRSLIKNSLKARRLIIVSRAQLVLFKINMISY
jgi:hypothetical protein